VVSRLRLFRQHFNLLGVAGSLSLHGLCVALALARAPGGVEVPAGDAGTSGAISVTLVSAAQVPTAVSALPAPPLVKASAEQRDRGFDDASSAPVSDGAGEEAGDRKALAEDDRATRDLQATSVNSATGSDYRARLLAHIQPFRRYPAQAEALDAKGVTQLIFRVDQDGRIIGVWVKSSSGFETLDNEAMATVLRAQPMPHVPPGLPAPLTVQLPVSFNPS
jgi:protein TonB